MGIGWFGGVAIARGEEKEELARELGAHEYIDSASGDAAEQLRKLGGANAILATAANSKSQGPLLGGLATRGKLIVLDVGSELIEINPMQLIFGSRTIQGEVVGTSIDEEDTLDFSALQAVRPLNRASAA